MKRINLSEINFVSKEVPSTMLNQINGGHILYTDYYNACTGKYIKTVKTTNYQGCPCKNVVVTVKKYIIP